jgi:hypothetical protein
MADYKLKEDGVQRMSDMAFIPENTDNRDWRAYLEWLDMGNTPDPEFTPEEILANAKLAEILELKKDLKNTLQWLFRMILEVWDVGKAKSLWDNTDITDEELKLKAAAWKAKLDRLAELGE